MIRHDSSIHHIISRQDSAYRSFIAVFTRRALNLGESIMSSNLSHIILLSQLNALFVAYRYASQMVKTKHLQRTCHQLTTPP